MYGVEADFVPYSANHFVPGTLVYETEQCYDVLAG